mmetsp:Transcript_10129/g.13191  ORF Transcript_10129/g.13191 Transcript_10129/m.13191 type:complete len:92 (-) Transcript_10129:18-293(-)
MIDLSLYFAFEDEAAGCTWCLLKKAAKAVLLCCNLTADNNLAEAFDLFEFLLPLLIGEFIILRDLLEDMIDLSSKVAIKDEAADCACCKGM